MHTIRRREGWTIPGAQYIAPFLARAARASRRLPVRYFDLLPTWLERASQRRCLRRLDGRMLRDIGVSRADVERECRKPFWRP
ncbi:MAG: DUF1127 domain-containing protein [Alphaproteobacteria bacterium]